MSNVFAGTVLLPGEQGPGLNASLEIGSSVVSLMSGDDALGQWDGSRVVVEPSGKGTFHIDFGDEEIFFSPSSPSKFAETMHIPLQPDASRGDDKVTYDVDAAIDELIAQVRPLTSLDDEDDILSTPILTGILITAGGLVAGIVGMSILL